MKIYLNILLLLLVFNCKSPISQGFATSKNHNKLKKNHLELNPQSYSNDFHANFNFPNSYNSKISEILQDFFNLAPKNLTQKLIIIQKVLNRVTANYPDIKSIFLETIESHTSKWFDEFHDIYQNKRISEDEIVLIIDILNRLTLSSLFFSKPNYNYDAWVLRLFSAIFGGRYDYRKVKSSKDKGITIYNGLYPWIISKSENPVSFLKTFFELILYEINNNSSNLIKIYQSFDKLDNRFDILLDILESIKDEYDFEKKKIFNEIWSDIHQEKFHILNDDARQKTFMRYIGTRILDQISFSS